MKVSAEWWRRLAALTLAAWLLAPARSGFAQVTTSMTSGAVTTTTTSSTTTTSTTVPTETTLDHSSTTTPPTFPVVLPEDPFPNAPDTPAVGPTFIASIPVTVTTEVVLPFSAPFSRGTTTTLDVEPIAFGAPTTASVTTTVTTLPPPTTASRVTLVQAAPAPVPPASSTPSRAWMVLAGIGVLAVAAVATWRRVQGSQQR